MLTTVADGLQLQFTPVPLTSVDMSTLQSRLEAAMEKAKKSRADLARACDISRAAVGKWFEGSAKNLKMEHLFAVADECQVDARWLATGKGEMKQTRGGACVHGDIPAHRIALIRLYSTLPDNDRAAARRFIETMAWMHHPKKNEYVQRISEQHMVHDK